MERKFRFTVGRLIGFICSALLPSTALAIGIVILAQGGVLLNKGMVITYFLLPTVAMGILALCMFSGCRVWLKVIVSWSVVILFVIAFSFCWIVGGGGFKQIKRYSGAKLEQQYATVQSDHSLMPSLSDMGQTPNLECYYVYSEYSIFHSETDYLICSYTPEEYAIAKERLETEYIFQQEPIPNENHVACEPMIEIGDYQFRLLAVEGYDREEHYMMYPKYLYLIGYSDDAHEIVYIAFEDWDLDYIDSLEDFVVNRCSWKDILKKR